jgi:hypothetical protein
MWCEKCQKELIPCIDIVINEHHYCPNCALLYVLREPEKVKARNVMKDDEYTYHLTKDQLIRLITNNLTQKQYKKMKERYPNSWYLHDDFYDEDGNRLQPVK